MWNLLCHFFRGIESQVRLGSSLSVPLADSGIAQGRVLSPLLFNLVVNGLIAAVRQVAPGVQLFSSSARSPGQLYADDLELMAESQHDLQVALDAVAIWAQKWRFTFGIGPTKSDAMVFGPQRHVPPCSVTLAGTLLPVVSECPYLGVILTPSLSWTPHVFGTWCLVATASSPSAWLGASLSVSLCGLRPRSSLPTCCRASLGGIPSLVSSCPSLAQLRVAALGEVPSGLAAWFPHRICLLRAWLARC